MGKITFFNEKGNIGAGAMLLIVGMAGLLISVLVMGVMEQSLVGSRVGNELLGNMTGQTTSFSTDKTYSTESTYMTFAIGNNTNIATTTGLTSLSACGSAPCYNASSETGTIVIDCTNNLCNLTSQTIWVNYTASELGSLALASGSQIASYVMTALNLISVGLIVLGAGLILSYLTNWRR